MNTPEQVRQAWDNIAEGFDRHATPKSMRFAEQALQRVDLRPGMQLLDVAAGSGALSLPAARLGAKVVATDISPVMIERLNARARDEGLSNLEGRVMDGHDLEFEDGTFDIAGSQNGVSLFPDPKRGLSELVRVTKPGGQVLLIAFGAPTKVEFLGLFIGALKATVPGFTGLDAPPAPMQLADPEKVHQNLREAGLNEVAVEQVNWVMEFESGRNLWDLILTSNPIGGLMVSKLSSEQKLAVQQAMDGMLRERSTNGMALLNAEMNVAVGKK